MSRLTPDDPLQVHPFFDSGAAEGAVCGTSAAPVPRAFLEFGAERVGGLLMPDAECATGFVSPLVARRFIAGRAGAAAAGVRGRASRKEP